MDVVFDVAKEIRNLQEVISNIKMDYEDELGKLKREVQELSSKKDESQAIVVYLQVDPGILIACMHGSGERIGKNQEVYV
ncbi:hypothetical protein HanPI659440_Chr05g0184351 [Helianthus annuus]|nr:hypothetical protein HanPI659440_Chr05g0184351 [Helianthus annuus]